MNRFVSTLLFLSACRLLPAGEALSINFSTQAPPNLMPEASQALFGGAGTVPAVTVGGGFAYTPRVRLPARRHSPR